MRILCTLLAIYGVLHLPLATAQSSGRNGSMVIEDQEYFPANAHFWSVGKVYSARYARPGPPCSGVLVSPTQVLTVFHCLSENGEEPRDLHFVVGEDEDFNVLDWQWEGQGRLPRTLAEPGPAPVLEAMQEELVLLTLSKPVESMKPMPILDPETAARLPFGTPIIAVGYPSYPARGWAGPRAYKTLLATRNAEEKFAQFNGVSLPGFSGGGLFVRFDREVYLYGIDLSGNTSERTETGLIPARYPHIMQSIEQ